MKRIIAFGVCLISLFAFCSCAKKAEPVNMNRLYSVEADVNYGDFSANVGLNRLGNGVWDINFTQPENINGLSVSYENDVANVSYNGLSFSINREDIPINSIVTSLTKTLDNAALGKNISFTKENGKITAKGSIDNIDYSIIFDEQTGTMVELKLPKIDLNVKFDNFKLIQ